MASIWDRRLSCRETCKQTVNMNTHAQFQQKLFYVSNTQSLTNMNALFCSVWSFLKMTKDPYKLFITSVYTPW